MFNGEWVGYGFVDWVVLIGLGLGLLCDIGLGGILGFR